MPVRGTRVPAILEYLPYRKDDATAAEDASRHPYFAAHGFAGVRVDLRGTGDSDGVCLGEYLAQEQADALEVLAWLEGQPWCTGAVGMIGYSWGGFNGLQVAALRPPQLKAVVTLYSTDDRYADDCHYAGGCLLGGDMLKWASWMLAFNARPADPAIVGPGWRESWLKRLDSTPPYLDDWVAHQRRDEFWRHGSVAEEYSAIEVPVLVVGGWADAYTNAVPRLLEKLPGPRRGIIGPWGHVFPERGVPGPAIGFLQECVRWFEQWLLGTDTGVMDEPLLRAWIQESLPPAEFYAERPGRWVSEPSWPPRERSLHRVRARAARVPESLRRHSRLRGGPQPRDAELGGARRRSAHTRAGPELRAAPPACGARTDSPPSWRPTRATTTTGRCSSRQPLWRSRSNCSADPWCGWRSSPTARKRCSRCGSAPWPRTALRHCCAGERST